MKELSAVISEVIATLNAKSGPVKALSVDLDLNVDGFEASVFIQVNRPRVRAPFSTEAVTPEMVQQGSSKKPRKQRENATISPVAFEDQPDEVLAALLALYPAKDDYTADEIAAASALLSSGSHGNAESTADEILQILKDNGKPRLHNRVAAGLMGKVLEWWDDLEDKSGFFGQLKGLLPAERETFVPVIYWKDTTGGFGKFEGKGQLEAFREFVSGGEMSGVDVQQITAKEFAKLQKENVVDYKALREEGLALVRKNATSNRDKLEALLREHGAVNPDTDKPSWTFIKDENLVAAVNALKAL